jgi:hypothetical protein
MSCRAFTFLPAGKNESWSLWSPSGIRSQHKFECLKKILRTRHVRYD